MTWYGWATLIIMAVSVAMQQLPSHGTETSRPVDKGESLASPAQLFARIGINDEIYRQRLM